MNKPNIADFTEQDEINARLVYSRCRNCGNQYASSILAKCPICFGTLENADHIRLAEPCSIHDGFCYTCQVWLDDGVVHHAR